MRKIKNTMRVVLSVYLVTLMGHADGQMEMAYSGTVESLAPTMLDISTHTVAQAVDMNLLRTPPGELIVEGKISLYKETETFGSAGSSMGSYVDNYYAKKGEIFKRVFVSSLIRDRAADLDTLTTLIQDDPEFVKLVQASNFAYTIKNLKRLIRNYNVKHFEGVGNTPYTTKSPATFYTNVKQKIRDKIILKVNDSVEYKMHPTYPTPIQLAASRSKPSKVCVIYESGSWCEIMSPVPLETLYFELNYSSSEKSFELEKRSLKEFKAFMEMHVLK